MNGKIIKNPPTVKIVITAIWAPRDFVYIDSFINTPLLNIPVIIFALNSELNNRDNNNRDKQDERPSSGITKFT